MKTLYKVYLLVLLLMLLVLHMAQAQGEKPDGFFNNGGTSVSSAGILVSSIGEPVVGLLKENWEHCLQGFVYKTIAFDFATSVDQPVLASVNLKLYPNPASNDLYIGYPAENFDKLVYSIFSQDGRLVKTGLLSGPTTHVDVTGLITATYILVLECTQPQMMISRNKFIIIKI